MYSSKYIVMKFELNNCYHLYNRGINRQQIFFSKRNYEYFLEKVKVYILPHCSLISYCLMPNHFHFLIHAHQGTMCEVPNISLIKKNVVSEGIRLLLSSYARAINKQEVRTGNLFQQKTKSKCLSPDDLRPGILMHSSLYEEDVFNYIHYNPVKAGLVSTPGEWEFSSYNEYLGLKPNGLCDVDLGIRLLGNGALKRLIR